MSVASLFVFVVRSIQEPCHNAVPSTSTPTTAAYSTECNSADSSTVETSGKVTP